MTGAHGRARVIWIALLASLGLVMLLALALRRIAPGAPAPDLPAWLGMIALPLAVLLVAGSFLVRKRLPARGAQGLDAWWGEALPVALACWALAEGAGMLGATFHLVTGSPLALGAGVIGLAALAAQSPAVLAGE